jgi:hypothetical protein
MNCNSDIQSFADRLSDFIRGCRYDQSADKTEDEFNLFALELFDLQKKYNSAYARLTLNTRSQPVTSWRDIPAVPIAAFKEFEMTSLEPQERTTVFHSSGTTGLAPSRHFHHEQSLKLYEVSALNWWTEHLLPGRHKGDLSDALNFDLVLLTPPPIEAPNSSLVHMFEMINRRFFARGGFWAGSCQSRGDGSAGASPYLELSGISSGLRQLNGSWSLNFSALINQLHTLRISAYMHPASTVGEGKKNQSSLQNRRDTSASSQELQLAALPLPVEGSPSFSKNRAACLAQSQQSQFALLPLPPGEGWGEGSIKPVIIMGTAFSFVQLCDYLAEKHLVFTLPPGSRALETGGYKNQSRTVPKAELYAMIGHRLGIPESHIVAEYGMSEMSSQAYDQIAGENNSFAQRKFHFPPWVRAQIISPETGVETSDPGRLKILDLANAWSVMALQTDDLAIGDEDSFQLLGRAALAEPRGCSLTAH